MEAGFHFLLNLDMIFLPREPGAFAGEADMIYEMVGIKTLQSV